MMKTAFPLSRLKAWASAAGFLLAAACLSAFSIYGQDNRRPLSEFGPGLKATLQAIGTLSVQAPDRPLEHRAGASLIWAGRCHAIALSVRHAVMLLEASGDLAFHADGPGSAAYRIVEAVYPDLDDNVDVYRDHPNDWALLVIDKPCGQDMATLRPQVHRLGFAEAYGDQVWFACYHHDAPFAGRAAVQGGPDDPTGAVRPKRARAFFAEFLPGFRHVLLHDFDHRHGASGCPLIYQGPEGWQLVGVHSSQSAHINPIRDGRPFGVSSNAGVALAFSPAMQAALDRLVRRLDRETSGLSHE